MKKENFAESATPPGWVGKEGLPSTVSSSASLFMQRRNLQPVKILFYVTGTSGDDAQAQIEEAANKAKETYGAYLANEYKIDVVNNAQPLTSSKIGLKKSANKCRSKGLL